MSKFDNKYVIRAVQYNFRKKAFEIKQKVFVDKKEKNKRALSFTCICAPYYIFIVNAPLFLYPIAFTLDPC